MQTISSGQKYPTHPSERTQTIEAGGYVVMADFDRARETRERIAARILDGIEHLEGAECRALVERDGLAKMHHHFPIGRIIELRVFVMREARAWLLRLAHAVGRTELGLPDPFYVDDYTALRFNYPYTLAKSGPSDIDAPSVGDTIDPAEAERVMLQPSLRARATRLAQRVKAKVRPEPKQPSFDIRKYHRGLPPSAWAHGPHIDTWYGHPATGINLWWSVAGTCEDNCLVFYPQLYGTDVAADPRSMFVMEGFALTEPHKLILEDGEAMLFNGEILHSTHLNIVDMTRIAFTTRLCRDLPTFLPGRNPAVSAGEWHRSDDIASGNLRRVVSFSKIGRLVPVPSYRRAPRRSEARKQLQVIEPLKDGSPLKICASEALREGEMMAVRCSNAHLLLVRDGSGVHAVAGRCPHVGLDLIDGSCSGGRVYCPGHGVDFDLRTGESKCSELSLAVYDATETDGSIFVAKRSRAS
jgi:nitrite reductase/ring-hydroxylating ferredoxin subunit